MGNSVQYAKSLLVWALLAPGHEFMVLIIKSILENEGRDNRRAYPLARVQAYQPFDGREDSILFGELSVHISAMRNRANQPKVEDEDKQEALFDRPADAREYELEFPNGKTLPCLDAFLRWPSA
jgi:hypothetical protein